MKGSLYFTIGLPRSGKSTYATEWCSKKPLRAVVSSDNIRMALTGRRYEPLAETTVFATKHIMIRALLERGFDVIVDGTHSTEISLMRLYEIDIDAKHICVNTDIEVCKKRAIDLGQVDLLPTIDRINKNLEELMFWDVSIDAPHPIEYSLDDIKQKVLTRNLYGNFSNRNM